MTDDDPDTTTDRAGHVCSTAELGPGQSVCATDCRDEVGVTVGLIDSLISIARVLSKRDLTPAEAQEALADLQSDEDMARVLRHKASAREFRASLEKLKGGAA